MEWPPHAIRYHDLKWRSRARQNVLAFELICQKYQIYRYVDRQLIFFTFCERAQNLSEHPCHLAKGGKNSDLFLKKGWGIIIGKAVFPFPLRIFSTEYNQLFDWLIFINYWLIQLPLLGIIEVLSVKGYMHDSYNQTTHWCCRAIHSIQPIKHNTVVPTTTKINIYSLGK